MEKTRYRVFGEPDVVQLQVSTNNIEESKRFLGERYDFDAELSYLNARYYDPALGLFLQPDWFEVMETGVGTNRYSYSFNDPVNLIDPSGNSNWDLFRGQEGSDRANEENSRDASDRADRIRERSSFLDALRDDLGLDDYWEGRADHLRNRVDKSWPQRAFGDAVVAIEVGSIAAGGGLVAQGAKAAIKRTTINGTVESALAAPARLAGRSGKQSRLREIMNDPKSSKVDKGWLRNDARHIKFGNKGGLRVPRNGRKSPGRKVKDKGYELAHPHNSPASQGNSYSGSKLKNYADHKVETRIFRGRGRY